MKTKQELILFLFTVNPRFRHESASKGHNKPKEEDFDWEEYRLIKPASDDKPAVDNRAVIGYLKSGDPLGAALAAPSGRVQPISLDWIESIKEEFTKVE